LGIIIFFAVLAANTVVFGGPMTFGPEDSQANAAVTHFIQTCKNTVQGRLYVTDDKGIA
jgi:hypothetical protein